MKRLRMFEIVFVLSLVGAIILQEYWISGLLLSNQQQDRNYVELKNDYDQLQGGCDQLNASYQQLQDEYDLLNASYRQLLSSMPYFFFQDPDFLISGMPNQRWKDEFWNYEEGSYINITNGIANLCYRQPDGERWGNANFLQGIEPHKNNEYLSLLVGLTEETASESPAGATFYKDYPIKPNTYLIKSRLKITERQWLSNTIEDSPKANIGVTLFCSFQKRSGDGVESSDYDGNTTEMRAVVIDNFFSSSVWNGTAFAPIYYKHRSFTAYGVDPTIVLTAPNQLFELNVWKEVVIDLGDVMKQTFDFLNDLNIVAITVKGVQVYAESSGVLIGTQIDYVKTELVK